MLELADAQRRFARAMTTGDGTQIVNELRSGADVGARLSIHVRHYAASLATAICDKFPGLAWLVGDSALRDAAIAYARLHPPLQPCIAEYGQSFPQFLAQRVGAAQLPYLQSFGELEWAIAQASIEIDVQPLTWAEVARLEVERILDSTLELQPGVHYVQAGWCVDDLMRTYVTGTSPERFVLSEVPTLLEVHGARGAFRLTRLDAATFAFRAALIANRTVGDAADAALAINATFDAGQGLREIIDARLAARCSIRAQEALS